MCGIAGKLHWGVDENNSSVSLMLDKMVHRGPNDFGLTHLPKITLGHRRLSIIDLSSDAKQPMQVENRYYITFNGEIYNYLEIKEELLKSGYQFRTQSDTEVVLRAYEKWGEECLKKFNGMWAFVIWDNLKKELFAARDRFGKKPFYYQLENGQFIFASELTALIQDKAVSQKTSIEALNCYLAIGYIVAPLTMYEGVEKLESAHFIKITNGGKTILKQCYWHYESFFYDKTTESEKEISEHLRHLLHESVKYRLISDVPVGAFLSGGIDSSAVVANMKQLKNDLHTFSIGFKYKSYNELSDADAMAQFLETIHQGEEVDYADNRMFINQSIDGFDEPLADNSLIPMYEVSKLAAKKVTVVLSGDGADELFAGYDTYKADKYYRFATKTPKVLRRQMLLLLSKQKMDPNKKIGFNFKLRQFLNGSLHNSQKAHYMWRLFFDEKDRVNILGEQHKQLIYETDPYLRFAKYYNQCKGLNWLDQHLFVDAKTWLTDDILVKVDRTTMQHSIEARSPFLDKNLVEYAARIPAKFKLKGNETKYILKEALKGVLPKETLFKKKSGFNAPIAKWINNNELDEFKTFNKYVFNRKINYAKETV
tara:strand:- start:15344 stop:17131 length:1788 start_codon:yes stop_codon:yes gene_type:complete